MARPAGPDRPIREPPSDLAGDRTVIGALRRLQDHVREPLFLHAYALGLSGLLTSGFGVVYWVVAARLYPIEVVGVNAALLSLVALLGNVSQLNLRSGFGRFVPVAARRTRSLIAGGYAAALAVAAVTSLVVVGVVAARPQLLPAVRFTPFLAWLFPVTVVLWTGFVIQDHVLTALRRTVWVPMENAIFSIAKIALLFVFVGRIEDLPILVSWTIPTALGVVIVSIWIFRWLIPRHEEETEGALVPEGSDSVTAASVARYVGGDYLASLFAIGSTSLLPVIVLSIAGAASSAHFYVVALVGSAAQLLPTVLSTSLLVELSTSGAPFERDARRVLRQLAVTMVPLVAILVIGAPIILGIFGADYAAEGTPALRLFALAGLPYSLVQLAFVRLRVERRVRWILASQAVLGILLVAGSVVALPSFGIAGIGAVALLSETLVAAVLGRTELWPLLRPRAGTRDKRAAGDDLA
jgi:O-antigen/teichoic acid export membrane protein